MCGLNSEMQITRNHQEFHLTHQRADKIIGVNVESFDCGIALVDARLYMLPLFYTFYRLLKFHGESESCAAD